MKKNSKQELETLLSSYLDGELTVNQAQKVEKKLTNDEDAQQLFLELKQVSGWVGDLPRELAPKHLSEDILFDLERNQLLNSHESISEQAGKNHLFIRRFVAAASLVLLVGVVATIIYQVLFGPIELADPQPVELAKKQAPLIQSKTEKTTILAAAEQPREAFADAATVEYSSIHLELLAQAGAKKAAIENWLTDLTIERFVPMHLSEQKQQYAFLCKASQLADLFDKFQSQTDHQVQVIISDSDRQTTLGQVDETQLLQLAMIADRSQQLALADHWTKSLTTESKTDVTASSETIATFQANQNESPTETQPQSLMPKWLIEAVVKIEPELTDLELLGPVDWSQDGPIYQQTDQQTDSFKTQTEQENAGFSTNTLPSEDLTESSKTTLPIPAIDPNQMVAIVLTYTFQDKPATDNNVKPESTLAPNSTATNPEN